MVGIEKLTISEARNELESIENQLELYLTKKKIEFYKTQPGATRAKEILIQNSNIVDRFNHYTIKSEEYDEVIYELTNNSIALQDYILKEVKRLQINDPDFVKILELRKQKKKWVEIARIMHSDERTCRRKIGLK